MPAISVTSENSNSLLNSARSVFRANLDNTSIVGSGFSVPGIANPRIAKLSATRIAVLSDSANTLTTYDFNGSSWSQVGNALSIAHAIGSIAAMSATRIALTNPTSDTIEAYDFNGTNWATTGSAFSLTDIANVSGIAALSSTAIALADSTNDKLVAYTFNGSTWSQTGNALTITSLGSCDIAALTSTRVAIAHNSTNQIRAYDFNGTDWSQTGTAATLSLNTPSISTVSPTEILVAQYSASVQYVYSFNGSSWTLKNTFSIAVSSLAFCAICSLTPSLLVFIEEGVDTIQTYAFGKAGVPFVLSFHTTTIQVFRGNSINPASWAAFSLAAAGTILSSVSGAIDSANIIHISWLDDAAAVSKLKYATFNCSTNTFSAITTINADIGADPVNTSLYTAIAIDSANIPHIACTLCPSISGTATYSVAYHNRIGGAWSTVVDIRRIRAENCTNIGIDIGIDNIPVVLYWFGSLNYVCKGNANNATSFTAQLMDADSTAGNKPSGIAINSSGDVFVMKFTSLNDIKIYKHVFGQSWATWTTYTDTTPTAILNFNNLVSVGTDIFLFYEDDQNDIRYCKFDGSVFSLFTLLETGTYNTAIAKGAFWADNGSADKNVGVFGILHTGTPTNNIYFYGGTGTLEKACQSIVLPTCKLSAVTCRINRSTSGMTDGIQIKVYSGSPEGTLLGTTNTVGWASFTGSPTTFLFSSPINITEGTYYFTVERTGARDAVNYYGIERISSSTHSGLSYSRNSGTWDSGAAADCSVLVRAEMTVMEIDYIFIDETATPDIWWDSLILNVPTAWLTKSLKWYNGSSWIAKPLKYYNGASWVTKTVKKNM